MLIVFLENNEFNGPTFINKYVNNAITKVLSNKNDLIKINTWIFRHFNKVWLDNV